MNAVVQPAAEAKKVPFCSKEYDVETGLCSFTFGNGKTIEFTADELPAEVKRQLFLHGVMQKVGDSYASVKGNYTEGLEKAQGVVDALKAGAWTVGRGEGEARPRLGELAAAIARIKSVALEVAMAAVEKATDDQRKQWRSNAKVKAVIAQIRAEAAAKALEDAAEKDLEITLA